ncbi:permease [Syntrophobacteraceae bacterium DRH4]|nr:permease [Desulfoferrobacter suflitae]MCK8603167.1 permease [Desulfoferrobacter suflitae]
MALSISSGDFTPLLFGGVLAAGLLLAGPALSLPNMLVIRSIMGSKKTLVFVILVVVMSTICGMIFGHYFS